MLVGLLFSCSSGARTSNIEKKVEQKQEGTQNRIDADVMSDVSKDKLVETPQNGEYVFDISFAEWGGKSMGEKVTVIINDDSIKIIYLGGKSLSAKKGEVLEEGMLLKHKSGNWIISNDKNDVNAELIGGCAGGPSIIDFKNKKYLIC